jgi:hypothetical protein
MNRAPHGLRVARLRPSAVPESWRHQETELPTWPHFYTSIADLAHIRRTTAIPMSRRAYRWELTGDGRLHESRQNNCSKAEKDCAIMSHTARPF